MSQKQKAAQLSAQSLTNENLTAAREQDAMMDFLLNGIGGGVGGTDPRGATPPAANPYAGMPSMGGASVSMPGLQPLQGRGWDAERVNMLASGDAAGALAPKAKAAYNWLSGAGTTAAAGAGAQAAGSTASGGGLLSGILKYFAV